MGLLLFTDVETHDNRSKAMEKEPAESEGQPRIAALSYILCDEKSGGVLASYYAMVRPDGWTMQAGAYVVNGLDMDTLLRRGLPIYGVIASIADVLALGESEPLTMVAHGLRFDHKTIRGELARAEFPKFYETTKRFCTMTSSVKQVGLFQEGTRRPKWPSLLETYQHYFAKAPGGQHNAFQDAMACRMIYFEKRKRGESMIATEPDGYSIVERGAPKTESAEAAAPLPADAADGGGAGRQGSPEPERQPPPSASPSAPPSEEDLI